MVLIIGSINIRNKEDKLTNYGLKFSTPSPAGRVSQTRCRESIAHSHMLARIEALGICGYMSDPFLRILAISVHDFYQQIRTHCDRVGHFLALSVST
jgi:hypothetical protein